MNKKFIIIAAIIFLALIGYLGYKKTINKKENDINRIISQIEKQNTKVAAHRVNIPEKIVELQEKGIINIEIDVFSDDDRLMVGHEKKTSSDISLIDYFEIVNNLIPNFNFIWLDMKDLTPENEGEYIKVLTLLNDKYNIKERVLIESRYPEALKTLSQNGWNTGYYLRYNLSEQPQEYVREVLQDLKNNNISAITFPCEHINYAEKNFTGISLNCWTFKHNNYRVQDYKRLRNIDRLLISVKTKNHL